MTVSDTDRSVSRAQLIRLLFKAAEISEHAVIRGTHAGYYSNLGIAAELALEVFGE